VAESADAGEDLVPTSIHGAWSPIGALRAIGSDDVRDCLSRCERAIAELQERG
jgi:hypothetical protein